MKKIYLIILALLPAILWAQPTLNNMYILPVGATYTMKTDTTAGVYPGAAGASQTWNYGTVIPTAANTSTTSTSINPVTAPYIDSFPTANVVMANSTAQYSYFHTAAGIGSMVGIYLPSASLFMYYPNNEQEIQDPMTYTNTYTDIFTRHWTTSGLTTSGSGTLTSTADAWGTITTPTGTYANCLRLMSHQTNVDTFLINMTTSTTNTWTWAWFDANHFAPLFQIDSIVSSFSTTKSVHHLTSSNAGINEVNHDGSLALVFPNPNNGEFTVAYHLTSTTAVLRITDLTGRVVYNENLSGSLGNANINSKDFNIATVGGIYIWELVTNEGVQGRGKISITK